MKNAEWRADEQALQREVLQFFILHSSFFIRTQSKMPLKT
jgi:hypothetical protein